MELRTVVNIVQVKVGILGVVDDNRSSQTIAILRGEMRMVPERSCLVGRGEIVQEGVSCCDGALIYEGGCIRTN